MDVEPDHDVEPALSLFSHVRPLRQDSHNTEGRDDRNGQKKISSNQFGLLQHQSRLSILMQVYTLMLFLKALHDFKMLNDSSLIGGARFHYCQLINVIWYHFSVISKVSVFLCQGGSTVLAMAESVECFPIPVPCHILKVCITYDI